MFEFKIAFRAGRAVLALLALSLFAVTASQAATLTVGDDPKLCDFLDLQLAMDRADDGDTIEIQKGTYRGPFRVAAKSLTLRGGHDFCGGERIGTSTLDGEDRVRVLYVSSFDALRFLDLVDLEITRGNRTYEVNLGHEGGGIAVYGGVSLRLFRVHLHDNQAHSGGGIFARPVEGLSPTLILQDSRIQRNHAVAHPLQALSHGGAVNYEGLDTGPYSNVILVRNTYVLGNRAAGSGGAFWVRGAHLELDHSADHGVAWSKNFAGLDGGALWAEDSKVDLFGSRSFKGATVSVDMKDNTAGRDGGALHLLSSTLEANAINLSQNLSDGRGGAIAAVEGSSLTIGQRLESCAEGGACNPMNDNVAGGAGGAIWLRDSSASLLAVAARGNLAGIGAAFLDATGGAESDVKLWSVALTDNKGHFLVAARKTSGLDVRSSTFAFNTAPWVEILASGVAKEPNISQSVFWENGSLGYVAPDAVDFVCNHVDDLARAPANQLLVRDGDPRLVPDGFRPQPWPIVVPILNMCWVGESLAAPVDIDYQPRPADGVFYDAGADEVLQENERIF